MPDDPPRLYLILPAGLPAPQTAGLLAAAAAGGDIASVYLPTQDLADDDARLLVKACMPVCVDAGAALLVADPFLARSTGCDGAHLDLREAEGEKNLRAAAKALKPKFILGAGGLGSRHAAMEAGESDVDYVMFGEPGRDGSAPSIAAVEERAQWWSELFNVPCVAYAAALDDITRLSAAGADFIALRDAVWTHAAGPEAAIREALQRLTRAGARA